MNVKTNNLRLRLNSRELEFEELRDSFPGSKEHNRRDGQQEGDRKEPCDIGQDYEHEGALEITRLKVKQ